MTTYDCCCNIPGLGKLHPEHREYEIIHHPEFGIFSYRFVDEDIFILFDCILRNELVLYLNSKVCSIVPDLLALAEYHPDIVQFLERTRGIIGSYKITRLPCNPSFWGISFKSVPQDLAAMNHLANLGNYKCDEIMEILRRSYIWIYFKISRDICQLIIDKVLLLSIERLDKELDNPS